MQLLPTLYKEVLSYQILHKRHENNSIFITCLFVTNDSGRGPLYGITRVGTYVDHLLSLVPLFFYSANLCFWRFSFKDICAITYTSNCFCMNNGTLAVSEIGTGSDFHGLNMTPLLNKLIQEELNRASYSEKGSTGHIYFSNSWRKLLVNQYQHSFFRQLKGKFPTLSERSRKLSFSSNHQI